MTHLIPKTFKTYDTDISEIKVRVWPNGSSQLVDECREMVSDIMPYEGIAVLEMPHILKSPSTDRGYWVYLTEYWAGTLPTETLLEVF